MTCIRCNEEIIEKTQGTMLCKKCYEEVFCASDEERAKIRKANKSRSMIWVLSCVIAYIMKSIVSAIIGFEDVAFINGFHILNLLENAGLLLICFIPVYFLLSLTRKK